MMFGQLVRRLRMLTAKTRSHQDLDEEIQLHLDLLERQQRARGMTADDARVAARHRFGNPLSVAEDARDASGFRWLDDLAQDVRYGVRSLLKQKRFALTALATLALGIGATTAIFSVVSALVLRPLPFPNPDRLVQIYGTTVRSATDTSLNNFNRYRTESTSFEAMSGYEVAARYLRDSSGADRLMAVRTEPDFFNVLRAAPLSGRTYAAEDGPNVAVISELLWRRRLDARASALGSVLMLDGEPVTIIGIMPEAFQFPYRAASLLQRVASQTRTDLWMPFARPSSPRGRIGHVIGRLKGGVSLPAAQAELMLIAKRLEAEDPQRNSGLGIRVVPLAQAVVAAPIRRVLFLLFGAVGLVLALACANVANLSLARITLRSREVAIRSSLGARRGRLIRQLLTESALLSLAGGALGFALAWWGTRRLITLAAPFIPRAHEIGLDWRVFAFLSIACAVTGAAVGIAPALIAARKDARAILQESGGHSTVGVSQRWLRDALVVAEVAIALVLAIAASVLIRELIRLRHTDSGMVVQNAVTMHVGRRMVSRGAERPYDEDIRLFYDIEERVSHLPGVRAAGFTQLLPLQSWGWFSYSRDFRVRGQPEQLPEFQIELRFVTPGYFQAQGIPIVKGRGFTAQDNRESPRVLLINETLARKTFGDRDPIGADTTRGIVVGVVHDVRQVHLDRAVEPELYTPIAQNWSQVSELGMTLVVSTRDRPEPLIDSIRSTIRDVNPGVAVFDIKTMDRVVAESLSDFTLYLSLIASFAALALVLAVTGTYGVISFAATSRVREFAVRMALGADRRRVMRLVIRQGLVLVIIGIVVGIGAALAAAPLLQNLPVTVRRPDVATTVPVALLLGLVAVSASLAPARRASKTDLMAVLRNE